MQGKFTKNIANVQIVCWCSLAAKVCTVRLASQPHCSADYLCRWLTTALIDDVTAVTAVVICPSLLPILKCHYRLLCCVCSRNLQGALQQILPFIWTGIPKQSHHQSAVAPTAELHRHCRSSRRLHSSGLRALWGICCRRRNKHHRQGFQETSPIARQLRAIMTLETLNPNNTSAWVPESAIASSDPCVHSKGCEQAKRLWRWVTTSWLCMCTPLTAHLATVAAAQQQRWRRRRQQHHAAAARWRVRQSAAASQGREECCRHMHIRTGREGGCNHIHIRTWGRHSMVAVAAAAVAAAAVELWSHRRLHRVCTSTASCPVYTRCLWLDLKSEPRSARALADTYNTSRRHAERHPAPPTHPTYRSAPHLLL